MSQAPVLYTVFKDFFLFYLSCLFGHIEMYQQHFKNTEMEVCSLVSVTLCISKWLIKYLGGKQLAGSIASAC